MSKKPYKTEPRHNPATRPASAKAQWLYAFISFGVSIFLLLSIPFQTTYFEGVEWFNQPRTWPSFAIFGMLVFGLLQLLYLRKYHDEPNFVPFEQELRMFGRGLEMAVWFAVYIFAVGYFGYMPSTIVFSLFMTWRMGYRRSVYYIAAVLTAIMVVVIFKDLLRVNIPGGYLYNYFPESMQGFLKTYM